MPRHINPLSRFPQTIESVRDDGSLSYSILPDVLTPGAAKAADRLTFVASFILLLWLAYHWHRNQGGIDEAFALGVICVIGYFVFRWTAYSGCRLTTEIAMSADAICIRGWGGWRYYLREGPVQVLIEVHEDAEAEWRKHDFITRSASARGKVPKLKPYYQASFHIVLIYDGQRAVVLSVYGKQEAIAIRARIEQCDRRIEAQQAQRQPFGGHPEKAWAPSPGRI